MITFEASRLSEGNKIFPAQINIDDFGVTLKIPGLLGGKEKTLLYRNISSVRIDTPMIGYSKITFDTIGFDQIVATGFSKADAQEIKQMVQQGISGARSSDNQSNPGANQSHFGNEVEKKAGGGFFGGLLNSLDASNEKREAKLESQVDNIATIQFGSTTDEISNSLNHLVTIAAGKPDKEVKKAICDKMEFAIMKLRQLGANAEADFFEKKRTDIKPKWYD